jgi:hypothetical protein
MNTIRLQGFLVALALCALAASGCNAACPGGHDPLSNPVGNSCAVDTDCTIECVCVDHVGDEVPVIVGRCQTGSCTDAVDLCEEGCGAREWNGAFCIDNG